MHRNLTRFPHSRSRVTKEPWQPKPDHPSVIFGKTVFQETVRVASSDERVLKSGHNNPKLGRIVTKGICAGMPIFHIALEERATCPRSCHHWHSCMGNAMRFAHRFAPGGRLEHRLSRELHEAAGDCADGFLVRVHTLGDFYSVGYVNLWREHLEALPQLHVFGSTARPRGTAIGDAVFELVDDFWPRFAVRASVPEKNHDDMEWITVWSADPADVPDGAVLCPAQREQSETCGTCGLCWHSRKSIAFLLHGRATK